MTIGTIPRSQFCAGDPISVTFTATGSWGDGNAFLLQLSNSSGSFSNGFKSVGSFVDTLQGTFTIKTTIPFVAPSSHYRFRILAASPIISSADNGSDITIGFKPPVVLNLVDAGATGGTATAFSITWDGELSDPQLQANEFWDFGSGATPTTATASAVLGPVEMVRQSTTYSTAGDKTVTLTVAAVGGCSTAMTYNFHVYGCGTPMIPPDAIVVNSNTIVSDPSKTFWINPGFTLGLARTSYEDTIFAEPGSTISGAYNSIIYLKSGSVLTSDRNTGSNGVIYGDGASIASKASDYLLNCPALDFDYSNAPPNPAHHSSSVQSDLNSVAIILSPNPTSGMLSVQGLP